MEAERLSETSGRGVGELERELGIGMGCLGDWGGAFRKEGERAFPGQGHMSAQEERIRTLEREVAILRQEREIPTKRWSSSRSQEHGMPARAQPPGRVCIDRMCRVLGV